MGKGGAFMLVGPGMNALPEKDDVVSKERELTAAERVYNVSTPVFTLEMGDRLAMARMKLGMSQGELGKKLGCSQSAISHLESGRQKVTREPFTVLQLKDLFGPLWTYILFGTNSDNVSRSHVVNTYWKTRLVREKFIKQGDELSEKVGKKTR